MTAGLLLAAPGSQAVSGQTNVSRAHPGYRQGEASWYYDDHVRVACGFHVRYGVANRTLKCGTKVEFVYGKWHVTATVDDRGPYIAGRSWDLDEHTSGVLHMQKQGVAKVWAKW